MNGKWKVMPAIIGLTALLGATQGSCGGAGAAASLRATAQSNTMPPGGGPTGMDDGTFTATLTGFSEVPARSTTGAGTFQARLSADGQSLTWTLTYSGLQGNAMEGAVTGAHLHLGQRGVAGGIAVGFCGGTGAGACPPPPATLTGTITSASVTGPTDQGLAAGDLPALLTAMRAGVTYVNVHTTLFPSGEIRGQVRGHTSDAEMGGGD